MLVGSRVIHPNEVARWDVEIVQISVYHGMKDNLTLMKNCVSMCREAGIRYVLHPVEFFILNADTLRELKMMAAHADLALILHDEKTPDGKRMAGEYHERFKTTLEELNSSVRVSFENATDTRDVLWFWDNYADSITLDIGHVEAAGLDSFEFIRSLSNDIVKKIEFVHMHRNNGWRSGLTDHWPLLSDCREMMALKELLRKKHDVNVILEINETEMIGDSINILRELREGLGLPLIKL